MATNNYKDSMRATMQFMSGDGAAGSKPAATDTDSEVTPLGFDPGYMSPEQMVNDYTSATTAKNNANAQFTDKDKQGIAANVRDGVTGVRDSYTADDKRNAYEHYDANLGAGSTRGNINGMSNARTLGLSRAVDAYNNATRWQPGLAGRRTNSSFGTNEMQANNYYKDTINTQDARQMRANERVDEQVRMYDAARQNRVDSHNMALQEKSDDIQMQMQQLIGQGDINFGNATRQLVMDLEYGEPNRARVQMAVSRYLSAIAMYDKTRVAQLAMEIWDDNPTLAQVYTQIAVGGQLPSQYEYVATQHLAETLKKLKAQGYKDDELYKAATMISTATGADTAVESVSGALDTVADSNGFVRMLRNAFRAAGIGKE